MIFQIAALEGINYSLNIVGNIHMPTKMLFLSQLSPTKYENGILIKKLWHVSDGSSRW